MRPAAAGPVALDSCDGWLFGASSAAKRRRVALLLLVPALLLAQTLAFDFVFDDGLVILEDLEKHGTAGLRGLLDRPVQVGEVTLAYYRPVITLTYYLDARLWGPNPAGYHLTNLLWHLAATLLVYHLARRTLGRVVPAWLAAALFALLPAHAEAIGWVQGRVDLVSAVLVLVALQALLRARAACAAAAWTWSAAAGTAWLLALLAKESALAFPLAAAPWLAATGRRGPGGTPASRLPLLLGLGAALLAYVLLRRAALGPAAALWLDVSTAGARGLGLLAAAGEYARLLVLPPPTLHFFRGLPAAQDPAGPALGLLALALLAALLAGTWRSARPLFPWAAWLPLTLLPALLWAGFGGAAASAGFVAERFLYLPSAGWCILAGALLAHALPAPGERAVWRLAAATAILIGYGALLATRLTPWAEPLGHYRALQAQPDLSVAMRTFLHSELARTHLARRELLEARRELLAGLALEPASPILANNLGALLIEEGRASEAVPWLERALRSRPDYADARRNLEAARQAAAAGAPAAGGPRP